VMRPGTGNVYRSVEGRRRPVLVPNPRLGNRDGTGHRPVVVLGSKARNSVSKAETHCAYAPWVLSTQRS